MKNWLAGLGKTYFLVYLPLIIIFIAHIYHPADSDLGWHLKYGEYFFRNHTVLRQNIFSGEMTNYLWVNSSWATDLITYFTYHFFGLIGLSLLAAAVMTLVFFVIGKASQLSFWEQSFLFPILIYLEEPLTVISFRGHLLTFLMISILYFILKKFEDGKKYIPFILIPLFTVWSNLHGEFILGLAILFLWSIFYIIKIRYTDNFNYNKRFHEIKILAVAFVGSIIATLINPFGSGIYLESFKHFGNPYQKFIIEWLPLDKFSPLWWSLVTWSAVLIISILILKKKKQLIDKLPGVGSALILLLLSYWARRYAWAMYLISIPVAFHFFNYFKPKNKSFQFIIPSMILISYYVMLIIFRNPVQNLREMSWDRYCRELVLCSSKSAEFLIKNPVKGNMLTFYNWGGWLIWNYPGIKPSIDGRMHLWQDKKGWSAFANYYSYEQNWTEIDQSEYSAVYMTTEKPLHKHMLQLVKDGRWTILYQDRYAGIFKKKIHSN